MAIPFVHTGNPQLTQSTLLTLHNATQSDANRAVYCQALNNELVSKSIGPWIDAQLAKIVATRHAAEAPKGPSGSQAPGPISQALWADVQAFVTNPQIEAALVALILKLIAA